MSSGIFKLMTWSPQKIQQQRHLTVYIEGDGFAWLNASTPSADPTPREPLALLLALAQPEGNAVYLGRPCQYPEAQRPLDAGREQCPQRYWTDARFAPEVVVATGMAIDTLKTQFGATQVTLVGYSGGGAVAALLAARRNDIEQLITVAGNLDPVAWTRFHHIDPLVGSLNPADEADKLASVPQQHFVGADDAVIPPTLVDRWPQALVGKNNANVRVIKGFSHGCCWGEQWAELYRAAQSRQ